MSYNTTGAYYPSPGQAPKPKSHRVRNFFIGATALTIGGIAGCSLIMASVPDGEPLEYSKPQPTLKSSAGQTITPPLPSKAAIEGDGMWLVPNEVKPGTYRSTANIDGVCYWARLRNLTGDGDSTIANGMGDRQVVTIKTTDKAFETRGCGSWVKVR